MLDDKIISFQKYVLSHISNEENLYFILSKCLLLSKLNNQKQKDIIKVIYPYIFTHDEIDYNSKETKDFIKSLKRKNAKDIIGSLYEQSLTKKEKRDLGQYYTRSNEVISYMLSLTGTNYDKVLDPSCGSGVFIIEIVKHTIKKLRKKGKNSKYILEYIFKNMQANDLDKMACKITEVNILIECVDLILETYNSNGIFVLPKLNITNVDFCDYNQIESNDLVIGNPPYITLYGKRSKNMNEEKRRKYNQFDFVSNKNGNNKFNMVMFFIENGIKSLKPNGKLIFIIDISFFETAFIDIRKYILRHCFIKSITTNISEFDGVASGQLIIELIKTTKIGRTKWIDYKTKKFKYINQEIWNCNNENYKIYIPLEKYDKLINEKVNKYESLDFYFPNKSLRTCCALTGRTEDFIVSKHKKTNNTIFPYLEGSKSIKDKFSVPIPTKYLEYDYDLQLKISNEFKKELELKGVKNKKRVTLGDKEVYLSPKIFIRQSATEIIATYTEDNYAANNSLYVLSTKANNKENNDILKYTCGILNSNLITYYCKINNIIRYGNGKTPQIKISDLKKVKMNLSTNHFDTIVNIVNRLLRNENYENNLKKLNKKVYEIYHITDNEIDYIEKQLEKNSTQKCYF